MAGDLLGVKVTEDEIDKGRCRVNSIEELLRKFWEIYNEASLEKILSAWDQEMQGTGGISKNDGS
jgi:hypothetical protein